MAVCRSNLDSRECAWHTQKRTDAAAAAVVVALAHRNWPPEYPADSDAARVADSDSAAATPLPVAAAWLTATPKAPLTGRRLEEGSR